MTYRRSGRPKVAGKGDLVAIRTYADAVSAEADRAFLEAAGITAHVFDGMAFNPIVAANLGAIKLQVADGDAEEALELLSELAAEEGEGDDEAEGTVRCPRCELAYCAFERPRIRNAPPQIAFLALPVQMIFGRERWHCHKCLHVWDDPKEGPSSVTRLKPGDPRPAFRLRRNHAGVGFILGAALGLLSLALFVHGPLGLVLLVAMVFAGVSIGRVASYDVCSVPDCRAPLPRDAEQCPKCKGGIAGVVERAEDHFSAAADFRRELAGIRASSRKKKKKKKAPERKKTAPVDEPEDSEYDETHELLRAGKAPTGPKQTK